MALVIVIAVVWLAILVPRFLRRRSAGDESDSISHFHRQLRVLEHSAPSALVTPAYRLTDEHVDPVSGDGWRVIGPPTLSVVGARDLPRPALAYLGEDRPEARAAGRGAPAATDDELGVSDPSLRPWPTDRGRSDDGLRRRTRRRRRDTLTVLALGFVVLTMLGFVPGASLSWAAAGVTGVALVAYVGLLVRLRRVADERARKLRRLRPAVAGRPGPDAAFRAAGEAFEPEAAPPPAEAYAAR